MDISFKCENQKFNYRVCAMMISDNKILAMHDERSPYFYLPGRRVTMGETVEQAVIREVQEELAIRLNVVRQTISKWETGLSVPDADMLISISEVFEIPVSTLLGEMVVETKVDDLKAISEKLEVINLQLAHRKATRQKAIHWFFISLCAVIVAVFVVLTVFNTPYLDWDYSEPETAVAGVVFHAFEWLFVRIAPFALFGAIIGICLTRKKM